MELKKLFFALLIIVSASSYSQIRIQGGGNMACLGIGQNPGKYALFGSIANSYGAVAPLYNSKVSIWGYTRPALGMYYYSTDAWGWSSIISSNQKLAKNWIADLNGAHNFFVTSAGTIYYYFLNKMSDSTKKFNINPLSNSLNKVLALQGYSYKVKPHAYMGNIATDTIDSVHTEKTHFGFLAQQLRTTVPEIIDTLPDNTLAVKYDEITPLLVEAIKEQQVQINSMQLQLDSFSGDSNQLLYKGKTGNNNQNNSQGLIQEGNPASLQQVLPTMADKDLIINYTIPSQTNDAAIYIYNMEGKQIKKLSLTNKGNAEIKIKAKDLKAGMYFYNLIVDGKEIDTKKMVLTK